MDVLIGLIPVVLTLLVLSRVVGEHPVFRVVQYLFVGLSLGYAFVVVYFQVLRPTLFRILADMDNPMLSGLRVVPIVLGLLLLPRILGRQSLSWLANIPLALLFGVGAALALAGAFAGTLLPQILDTVRSPGTDPLALIGLVTLAIGVVLTLMYFYFTVPRNTPNGRLVAAGAQIGRWLLMVAFGFFFAGALLTYITALNERLVVIINWVGSLIP